MPRDPKRGVLPTAEQAARATLDIPKTLMKGPGEAMLRNAPRLARVVARRIPGLPGLIYDVAAFAKAGDKTKAAFGLAGGAIGGLGGGALGAAAGGINAPIGAALGAAYGERIAEELYDDHEAEIDQWMKDRWADVRGARRAH